MTDREQPRTFSERIESMNVAFLVKVPVKLIERFAQLVEEAVNDVEGRLVYTKVDSERLAIVRAERGDFRRDEER